MSAHEELSHIFTKKASKDANGQPEYQSNIHGNIKSSNIFIENAGQNANYQPIVLFSDRASTNKPTNDHFSIANVIHELVCGMRINKLDGGKLLYHYRVKNSTYFSTIQSLVEKSKTAPTVESVNEEKK